LKKSTNSGDGTLERLEAVFGPHGPLAGKIPEYRACESQQR
jgi:hypothetical protein